MEEIKALRAKAEDSFNNLQSSINSIREELKKYGLETIEEALAELNRLQGEYRAYQALENTPAKASKKADVIDATPVDPAVKEPEAK